MLRLRSRVDFQITPNANLKPIWVQGTIVKINPKNYKIIGDGGEYQYTIAHENVKPSRVPAIPVVPDCMSSWKIEGYRMQEGLSEASTCYTAYLFYKDLRAGTFYNSGKGDKTDLFVYEKRSELVAWFYEDLELWIGEHYGDVKMTDDVEDFWVNWKIRREGFNVTPAEAIVNWFGTRRD